MFFFSHAITVLSAFLLVHAIQGFNTVTGTSKRDTFIISFDGVLASNADVKAKMAIEAAILTWPGLLEDDRTYSLLQPDNRCWLTNKMRALSHLNYGQDSYRSLLVRLLVEEQLLDNQQSAGKTGKYASKFHPRSNSSSSSSSRNDGSTRTMRSSRPLTVGEISANWEETLKDTLSIRYNVDGKDPLPVICKHMNDIKGLDEFSISESMLDSLNECIHGDHDVYILLKSKLDYDNALNALMSKNRNELILNANIRYMNTGKVKDMYLNGCFDTSLPTIKVAHPKDNDIPADSVCDIIRDLKNEGDVFLISDYSTLVATKEVLIGPDSWSPTFSGTQIKVYGNNMNLSLLLPSWADNVDQNQDFVTCAMDPYMRVIERQEFREMLSAKYS